MSIITIVAMMLVAATTVISGIYAYRTWLLYRVRGKDRPPVVEAVCFALCIFIGNLTFQPLSNYVPLWVRVICPMFFIGGLFIIYLMYCKLYYGQYDFYRNRIAITTVELTCINLVFNLCNWDNINNFVENTPFTPTATYFLAHYTFFGSELYLYSCLVHLVYQNRHQYKGLSYAFRYGFTLAGFISGICTMMVVLANLSLYLLWGPTLRTHLNQLFFLGLLCIVTAIVLSFAPQRLLRWVFRPWEEARQTRLHNAKQVLHAYLIRVVPSVQLRSSALREQRYDVEIEQARYMIWTNEPRARHLRADDEAILLLRLVRQGTTITMPGICSVQPPRLSLEQHYVAVAHYLSEAGRTDWALPETVGESRDIPA